MSYVIQLDQLDRVMMATMTVVGIHRALGNDVPMPDPIAVREEFDAALCAEPKVVDAKQLAIMQGLGLRVGR